MYIYKQNIVLENAIQSVHAHVHKTTYAQIIYMPLYVMVLMGENALLGQVGGG